MPSPLAVPLVGRQAPRVLHRPPHASEDAAVEAIELAESVGLVLDPWQQTVVRAALAEQTDGRWSASEVGFLVARQNGKGGALEAIVLHGMFLVGDPLTLWTAHQTKTAFEAMLRMRAWIDGSDDLRRRVRRITTANGDEGIELTSGARLRFVARSKSSGRGFSPQRIVFDEAQELSTLAVEALVMSSSAQANRQLIFTGTVPSDENDSTHWTSVRDRGRAGKSERLAWLEWSPRGSDEATSAEKVDLDDRRVWAASNPALGYRITEDTVASEREAFVGSPESFARERLSVWPKAGDMDGAGIDPQQWAGQRDPDSTISGAVAFGIAMTADRSTVSVSAVGVRQDGRYHGETVESRRGTTWLTAPGADGGPSWLAERVARNGAAAVVIDPSSPAGSLIPEIEKAGLTVDVVTVGELVQACGRLSDLVTSDRFRHIGQAPLDAAVAGSKAHVLTRGGWLWRQRGAAPIAELQALTLALHGFESSLAGDPAANAW